MPFSSSDAAALISTVSSEGVLDGAIKGIGRISLWDSGGIQTSRAAWAGTTDGRLRIEMLGLPGHPVAKFIYDGMDCIFISPLDQRTYRKNSVDADLDSLTGIAVPTGDIIKILSGAIPVALYDEAALQYGEPHCRDILVLKKKWHGVVEKLFLNQTHDRAAKVEFYRWGRIVYRAEISDLRDVDGRAVPFRIVFSDADQKGFSIDVEKCWLDMDVSPEMFSIESE